MDGAGECAGEQARARAGMRALFMGRIGGAARAPSPSRSRAYLFGKLLLHLALQRELALEARVLAEQLVVAPAAWRRRPTEAAAHGRRATEA